MRKSLQIYKNYYIIDSKRPKFCIYYINITPATCIKPFSNKNAQ